MQSAQAIPPEGESEQKPEGEKKATFSELLFAFTHSDEMAARPIDFEKIIGDISKDTGEALKQKVDALEHVLTDLKWKRLKFMNIAEEYRKHGQAIEANEERLKKYVAENMKGNDVDRVEGDKFYISRTNFDRVVMTDRQATAEDYLDEDLRKFVEQKTVYKFKTEACKEAYEAGTLPEGICKISNTNYIRFWPNKGKPAPKKKKTRGKKK